MIFWIFILIFSLGLIKAISNLISEKKKRNRAIKKLKEFEKRSPPS